MKSMRSILFLLAMTAACGGHENVPSSANAAESSKTASLLTAPLSHFSGDPAEALVGDTWRSVRAREPLLGAREIRAQGRGSVVNIGESRVWLRGGAHMRISQDAKGKLRVSMQKGQARVVSAGGASLVSANVATPLVANDVVIRQYGSRTAMVATSQRPEIASWSLELDEAPELRGVGTLEVEEASQSALELRKLSVSVSIEGGMAVTEVEHVFYNADDVMREGTFRFPAPDGVIVTGMAMEINGKLMEGEFVERVKARKVYESIVDQMQDPALLEWQQGGWFKLRVFPIEANREKRVVLRYAAPLTPAQEGYEYRYLATPPEQNPVGHFAMYLDGDLVSEERNMQRSTDVILAFPEGAVPASVSATVGDYSYRAVRVRPTMEASKATAGAPRELVIAMDSSRSALENRGLSLELVSLLLAELGPKDTFALFAHDIEARSGGVSTMVPATDENVRAALKFANELEFDGASDLGATLSHAQRLAASAKTPQIVYIGDGTPSWGKTSQADLITSAAGDAPVHAALVGRGASTELWEELCGVQGGRLLRPRTRTQARKDAFFLARSATATRMQNVRLAGSDEVRVFPGSARTLFAGDALTVVVRAPKGEMPKTVSLTATAASGPIEQKISLASASEYSELVPKQWATHEIARLESGDGAKEDIVALSRDFGVLSKHTSLLVLESEEAYKQHQIERRNAKKKEELVAQNAPAVTGHDLDNLGGRQASLSPDHIQPGDPEVRIPAPADARSVVLVFPFGDTKLAHYDAESQTWIARFLIDPETADGRYWVRVTVEHANGELEEMRLPYTVDTQPPSVSLRVVKLGGNRFRILVAQDAVAQDAELGRASALDASRVEVLLPWGQTHRLYRKEMGSFRKTLRAPQAIGETMTLRVVVTDQALNQRVLEVTAAVETL